MVGADNLEVFNERYGFVKDFKLTIQNTAMAFEPFVDTCL